MRRLKVINQSTSNEMEINRILNSVSKYKINLNEKSFFNVQSLMSIILQIIYRRIKYDKEADEISQAPQLKFLIFEELLTRYK